MMFSDDGFVEWDGWSLFDQRRSLEMHSKSAACIPKVHSSHCLKRMIRRFPV